MFATVCVDQCFLPFGFGRDTLNKNSKFLQYFEKALAIFNVKKFHATHRLRIADLDKRNLTITKHEILNILFPD